MDEADWPEVLYTFCALFFGISTMLALFSRFRSTHLKLWKELTVATTSYLIMFQQLLKKSPVNPSGPGALSDGNCLMACRIS